MATKKMFNISASPGIESSGSANLKYTNPNNTTQGDGLLQDASKLTNDMVYINNVTYGARVIAIVQLDSYSKQTSDKISAALEFGFAGGSADMMSKLQSFNTTMSITYYCVGGNSGQAKYARNFDEMEHDIRSLFEGLNYKNAQPVSYTLANINNENIKARSATDEYTSRSCFSDDDKKIEAFIDKMEKLDGNETDLEIYGQVWARVFDGAGKEIFPGSVSDRLFDLIRDQHLNAGSFISNAGWKPNKVVQFTIPNNGFRGSKIVIYYWFMDQDKGGEANDDLLSRRGGNGEKRKDKRGYIFDAREFNLDQGYEDNDRHTFKKYDEFTDKDGESGIKFSAIVKISDLPASKK